MSLDPFSASRFTMLDNALISQLLGKDGIVNPENVSSSSSLAGEDGFVVLFPTESDLSGNFSFACF